MCKDRKERLSGENFYRLASTVLGSSCVVDTTGAVNTTAWKEREGMF